MIQKRSIKGICLAVLFGMMLGVTLPVFAEAPVFEAEALPAEQEMATDQTQDESPPLPPPMQAQEGETFVPMQQPAPSVPPPTNVAEDRLERIEQQMGSLQNGGSGARVQALQEEVQTLRNQVEILSHQLEEVQNQQKTQFADLDKRLAHPQPDAPKLAAAEEPVPPPVIIKSHKKLGKRGKQTEIVSSDNLTTLNDKSVDGQPNVAEEQQIYQTAYNLIKAKKYEEAVKSLQGMLKRYPSGQFASNAHYWLGELYGLMSKNELALREFSAVVEQYPDSPRVSDAQLKVGMILASEFKWIDAKSVFRKVVQHYPGSASARLATEQLKQIRQAGH